MSINLYSKWLPIGFAALFSIFLVGCTQKFNDTAATFKEAYSSNIDVSLSPQEILDIPYASAYLRIGNQQQVFVVLAFAEKNPRTGALQLKWVSADKAMIVTENGRIVKTLGLMGENLANIMGNPPKFDTSNTQQSSFTLTYDWSTHYKYGFTADVTRTIKEQHNVVTPITTSMTNLVVESVHFPSLSTTIENRYWVDKDGKVKKTIQHLGPNMAPMEFTVLKGYASNE